MCKRIKVWTEVTITEIGGVRKHAGATHLCSFICGYVQLGSLTDSQRGVKANQVLLMMALLVCVDTVPLLQGV